MYSGSNKTMRKNALFAGRDHPQPRVRGTAGRHWGVQWNESRKAGARTEELVIGSHYTITVGAASLAALLRIGCHGYYVGTDRLFNRPCRH
jgi:hypothetical protein